MTTHEQDDVLATLTDALSVEPSRQFTDGVRRRVAREQVRSARVRWMAVTGLAAAACAVFATMSVWNLSSRTVPGDPDSAVALAPVSAPAAPVDHAASSPVVERAPVAEARRAAPSTPRPVQVAEAAPPLEVITNQGAVLRAMWADYRGVAAAPASLPELPMPEAVSGVPAPTSISVEPVIVPPVVIGEWQREVRPGGGTLPINRRADAAIKGE